MKLLAVVFLFLNFKQLQAQQLPVPLSANVILQKSAGALGNLKKLQYTNKRELNYASNNYRYNSVWTCYYNFETTDTTAGFIYQVEDSTSTFIFNGSEYFNLNKPDKEIEIIEHPQRYDVTDLSFTYNSIITLRNILPLIIEDKVIQKSVADTLLNGKMYYLVVLNMGKRRIQNFGKGFDLMKTGYNFIYKIIIDKNNYLPYSVIQMNDSDKDFIRTTFEDIDTAPANLPETSWYYSTYITEYKRKTGKEPLQLIKKGSQAPEWELVKNNALNEKVALSRLKGKVVLIDFWIKNCGPCIQSVPQLNELYEKFKNNNFEIVSINAYDSKNEVGWFSNKYHIKYSVLLEGKSVAEKYGVAGFPTFIIADKKGNVVYTAEGYNIAVKAEIEKIIKEVL